jgi:hypothetical protein
MKSKNIAIALILLASSAGALATDSNQNTNHGNVLSNKNDRASIGAGYFQTFIRVSKHGKPRAIGVKFPKTTLQNLPMHPLNDGKTCYDLNGDDEIDLHDECTGGHSRTLYFNSDLTPFKNITVNWEPHGHVPAGIYDSPHFDFHFYLSSDIERKQITPGPCTGLMNCVQEQIAIMPLPSQFIHSDFINTELAFAHMGNHYVDSTSPELNGGDFTHTFIQGSYDSQITFYEPMVSRDFLLEKPNFCTPIKTPMAFETAGYYPTKYCMRYKPANQMYRVSLEGFVYREAY